jgi:formamidopyrimidine-DNA glycosylase
MPEGAEVKAVAVALDAKLCGKWLMTVNINSKSRYAKVGGIEKVEKIPFPLQLRRVYSKGKKVIFEFPTALDGFIVYLVSTLAMSGRWQYDEGKHSGIELVFEDCSSFFEDQRHFGSLVVCFGEFEKQQVLKAFGPDLLSEDISFEMYDEVISNKRIRKKQICNFL